MNHPVPAADPLDFPPELCSKATALVGLWGLDVGNNSLHRAIWEAFSKKHDKAKANFKLFNSSYKFPDVKPKKTTYDYIPKGLLKRNWMQKHLLQIPAAIAFLYELNWDDTNWEQMKTECVNHFQILRSSLGGHSTKLAIILIQRTAPLPAGEDVKAADRARALCAACDIDTKQLFVLSHADHMQGYVTRLETALYDLAQNYYLQKIRSVKQYKDTHQYLLVRHQFKIGFFSELKQDTVKAKKNYEFAYAAIKEVKLTDTNLLEVKLVAGFINYKICQLMFKLNEARDAVSQFLAHVDFFKHKTGPKELLFEHHSWLSKQYSAFGDVFDDAIRLGLVAVQTQHPGFYYKLAAQHAIDRKHCCLELCKDVTSYPEVDPLAALGSLEFFGQRPWRPGKLSAELGNPAVELSGTQAIKFREKAVDYSSIIISLLGNAISQFKTYKCPRMRLQLVVKMADEYYASREYGKALTLLSHMVWDYRSEHWWELLSLLLARALACAYLSASVQDYIVFALEALSPSTKLAAKEKERIFNNLMKVLKMRTPDPEPDCPPAAVADASALWAAANSGKPLSVSVDMTSAVSCVEVKASFSSPEVAVHDVITVPVHVRSSCPAALEFSHLSVVITSPNYSSEFACSSDKTPLTFEPGVVRNMVCEVRCDPADAGKELQIAFILLTLGAPQERCAVLKFSGGGDAPGRGGLGDEMQRLRVAPADALDGVQCRSVARVLPLASRVAVRCDHEAPALLGEWFPVRVTVDNQGGASVTQAVLDVRLQVAADDPGIEQSTQLTDNLTGGTVSTNVALPLQTIEVSQSQQATFYLRGHRTGDRTILVKLSFGGGEQDAAPGGAHVDHVVKVPVVKPFEISAEILSMKFEQLVKCFAHDAFIVSPCVQVLSPWPLKIHHSTLELGLMVRSCDAQMASHLADTELAEGETGTDMFAVVVDEPSDGPVALGSFVLRWSRAATPHNTTSSTVTMPAVRVDPCLVGVDMQVPAHGWVRRPMPVVYRLHNHSGTVLQLELSMETSDAFMYSGRKKVFVLLLPGGVRTLEYSVYPLFSGMVALPRLILMAPDYKDHSEQLVQVVERNCPSHVYVMVSHCPIFPAFPTRQE